MTIEELVKEVEETRRWRAEVGIEGVDTISLTLFRETPPRGEKVRLASRIGPFGEVLCVKPVKGGAGYSVVASFSCQKILDFLEALNET